MSFVRANPLGWGWGETFYSLQCNLMDLQGSRALDGFAGGTYNPTAAIVINNQFEVNSTGAAGANVVGIIATGKGFSQGIYSTGGPASGDGVMGIGGAPNGDGVSGSGTGTGSGIKGVGGVTDGSGVSGIGNNAGAGVSGVGGATNGKGVNAQGTGAGTGVYGVGGGGGGIGGEFIGGAAGGHGASGLGVLAGTGLTGIGGATDGIGVQGTGGAPDGIGVDASAAGTGAAVKMTRVGGVHMHMVPRAGDPAGPVDGDIWLENDNDEIIAKVGGDLHQVLDTWAHISVAVGAAPGNCTLNDGNNVTSIIKTAQYVELTFQKPFASVFYSATATADLGYFAGVGSMNAAGTRTVGTLRVYVYSGLGGGLMDLTAIVCEINVHIKGYF